MKAILFANTDWYLYNFRLPLARALRQSGHQVNFIAPPGPYINRLRNEGFRCLEFPLDRRGVNPFAEVLTIMKLAHVYRRERPDLVHHFTPKCILYGSAAGRLSKTYAVMNTFTGLGYIYTANTIKARISRMAFEMVLRWSLHRARHAAIFHNSEDCEHIVRAGIINREEATVVGGTGVDTAKFVPQPEREDEPLIVLPARLLWDKGVGEFVQAARLLRKKGVRARFVLVGMADHGNPTEIPKSQVDAWEQEGVVEWWGHRDDITEVFACAHVVVLPSYREGLPRVLVEAAACARPIVSTDIPGCREIVRHGENGLLVQPKDPISLAQAMALLVSDGELRNRMGAKGRQLVVSHFSSEIVLHDIFNAYESLLGVHLNETQAVSG